MVGAEVVEVVPTVVDVAPDVVDVVPTDVDVVATVVVVTHCSVVSIHIGMPVPVKSKASTASKTGVANTTHAEPS